MESAFAVIIIAIGGAMLLEGAMYTLFPDLMKRAMAEVQFVPPNVLRGVGLGLAALGLAIVYFMLPQG